MSGEKRTFRRQHLKYPASIDTGDGTPPRECFLADVSEGGARVLLKKREDLPDRFILRIGPIGAAPRLCRVVWREGAELGLEFRKTSRPKGPLKIDTV